MIAITLTLGSATKTILSDVSLATSTRARLERAGYRVCVEPLPKHVRSLEALDAVLEPLLQRDLFAGLS